MVKRWGFESIAVRLFNQLIDEENFADLEKKAAMKICNDVEIGLFMKFWKQYNKWKSELHPSVESDPSAETNMILNISKNPSKENFSKINVKQILSACAEGKSIIESYNSRSPNQYLLLAEQLTICTLITNNVISQRLHPGRKDLREIAEQISSIFKSEDPELYVKKGSGGLLANKINNRLEKAREKDESYPRLNAKKRKMAASADGAGPSTSHHEDSVEEISSKNHDLLSSLKNPNASWTNVEHNWNLLFDFRQALIKRSIQKGLVEIYSNFPIINNPNAFQLVSIYLKRT
jgi:hypothetical protein